MFLDIFKRQIMPFRLLFLDETRVLCLIVVIELTLYSISDEFIRLTTGVSDNGDIFFLSLLTAFCKVLQCLLMKLYCFNNKKEGLVFYLNELLLFFQNVFTVI
jgi:hypothetical protein